MAHEVFDNDLVTIRKSKVTLICCDVYIRFE